MISAVGIQSCPRRLGYTAAVCLAVLAPAASAQNADTGQAGVAPSVAAADALFREGRRLFDSGDFTGSREKFAESNRLDPAAGTLISLALSEQKLGMLASAWTHFKEAGDRLTEGDDRLPLVAKQIRELDPQVPRLTIVLSQTPAAGVQIEVDGVQLAGASSGVALPIDPGKHRVVVKAAGHAPFVKEVSLVKADRQRVEVRLTPERAGKQVSEPAPPRLAPVGPPSPQAPPAGGTDPGGDEEGGQWLGWGLVGLGAVGLVTGAVTGILVLQKKNVVDDPAHCDAQLRCDQVGQDAAAAGKTFSVISPVAFGVGALALGIGGYLLLVDSGSTTLGGSVWTSGGGMQLRHRF